MNHPSPKNSAFTLVELIVSIALALILLLGIARVFALSTEAIGAGEKIGSMQRQLRGAQLVMQKDCRALMKDSPVFYISSSVANNGNYNFLNPTDRLTDKDNKPGTYYDPSANSEKPMPAISFYNDRNHRADMLGFFARGTPLRHTGDDGSFVSTTRGVDYWVHFGHLKLYPDPIATNSPDKATGQKTSYLDPGIGNIPEPNTYAANWALGRVSIIFRDQWMSGQPGGGFYAERYLVRNFPYTNGGIYTVPTPDLSPLSLPRLNGGPLYNLGTYPVNQNGSFPAPASADKNHAIDTSRYDLVGGTVEQFRQDVQERRRIVSTMLMPNNKDFHLPDAALSFPLKPRSYSTSDWDLNWWQDLVFRYQADPVVAKPLTSENVSRTAPLFVQNCTQFMVEYAGDYLTQNPLTGDVTSLQPDGIIDFLLDDPNNNNNDQKPRVRWYGLPRDTNDDGKINYYDVVPLRDIRVLSGIVAQGDLYASAPFEREVPPYYADYATLKLADYASFRYTCLWVNSAPAMVRVIMKVDDPGNRLREGQSAEFILQPK